MVDEQVCADSWQGVVRREDVRGWEKDKVVVGEGFRVGDLVRGVVVSSSFLLLPPLCWVLCASEALMWGMYRLVWGTNRIITLVLLRTSWA